MQGGITARTSQDGLGRDGTMAIGGVIGATGAAVPGGGAILAALRGLARIVVRERQPS